MADAARIQQVLMQSPPHVTEEDIHQIIETLGSECATVGDILAAVWNVPVKKEPSHQNVWHKRNALMDDIYEHISNKRKSI